MFYIGLLTGAAILGLIIWTRNRGWKLTWYEWVISAIGLALLFLAVQHYFGSMREMVNLSANLGLIFFGIPAIILLVVAWRLSVISNRSS